MSKNKKNKNKFNLFYRIFGIISTIIAAIFTFYIIKLGMLPTKYLSIFIIVICIIYAILLLLTLPKKIKIKIKTICFVFFLIFGLVFGFGIKYMDKTISFINRINSDLFQKEDYYLMVLSDSDYSDLSDLTDEKLGTYVNKSDENISAAIDKLTEKIDFKEIDYTDLEEMLKDLSNEKISAIFIKGSARSLIESEFVDFKLKVIHTISVETEKADITKAVDVTKNVFNVYIAGGDSYGSIDIVTNTDVNMVATIDPLNRKILLTSIPRDYYVNLPSYNAYDKLTHAGYYGIDESVAAVEELLDIDINYYVKVNFSTVEGVIDAIGGVDVDSDYSFCVTTTGVCVKKGINHLNGYQAMMFARERHSFIDGDIQRVKNQQKVLMSVINKITSSTSLVTNYSNILDSVSENFSTNLDTKSINKLVKMQLNNMKSWNIESQNLIGKDLYSTNTYSFPGTRLYVMEQDEESVNQSKQKIKTYFK